MPSCRSSPALLQSYQTVLGLYMLFRAVLRAVHLALPICPTIEKTSELVHTWRDHRIDILSSLSARPRGEGRRNKSTRPIKLNPLSLPFRLLLFCCAVASSSAQAAAARYPLPTRCRVRSPHPLHPCNPSSTLHHAGQGVHGNLPCP